MRSCTKNPTRFILLQRKTALTEFIREKRYGTPWIIEPLLDRYGSATEADFDAIVVSEETLPVAVEINSLRRAKKKPKVDIHQITCVLAEDGRWISSTRIWRGEIDIHGHLLPKK